MAGLTIGSYETTRGHKVHEVNKKCKHGKRISSPLQLLTITFSLLSNGLAFDEKGANAHSDLPEIVHQAAREIFDIDELLRDWHPLEEKNSNGLMSRGSFNNNNNSNSKIRSKSNNNNNTSKEIAINSCGTFFPT